MDAVGHFFRLFFVGLQHLRIELKIQELAYCVHDTLRMMHQVLELHAMVSIVRNLLKEGDGWLTSTLSNRHPEWQTS